MEVDEKPEEEYSDIGGLDKQIQELVEAVVLPMTHAERFIAIGIKPPKGVLLHGPPGTGKTLLARACAKQTDAIFLKLAGPQLVQMFIGDGAKVRTMPHCYNDPLRSRILAPLSVNFNVYMVKGDCVRPLCVRMFRCIGMDIT